MKFSSFMGGLITGASILFSAQTLADNPMKSVFNNMVSNSTSSGTFSTRQSNGWSGGGYSYRVPNTTPPPLVTFSPPKASVGCNGADFFLGSFSVINKDELVQIMRGIANGSAAFAFSVAMEAVCPTCIKEMERLQEQLAKLNADSRSACRATMEYLNQSGVGGAAHKAALEHSLIKPGLVSKGLALDTGATDTMDPDKTVEQLASNTDGAAFIKENVSANLTWSALKKIGVDSWVVSGDSGYSWNELLMSLFGTVILQYDSTGKRIAPTTYESTISLTKLVDGPSDGETIRLLHCDDDTVDCLKVTSVPDAQWTGLRNIIFDKLILLHGYMRNRSNTQVNDASMKAFQNMFSSQSLMVLERSDDNIVDGIAESMASNFVYNVVGDLFKHLLFRMSNLGVGVKDAMGTWVPSLKDRRREISDEAQILAEKGLRLAQQETANLQREKILLEKVSMK